MYPINEKYAAIITVLGQIDNNPNYTIKSEADITLLFRNSLEQAQGDLETFCFAEFYAFTFYENVVDWENKGTYFGSPRAKQVSGEWTYRIPFVKITCEHIGYWKLRASQCKHPVLKARYAGLTWDLEKKICQSTPDFKTIAIPYVENLLQAVDKGLVLSFPGCREKLRRALELSFSFKQPTLQRQAIKSILLYQEKAADPSSCGTWRLSYDLLIQPGITKQGDEAYATIISWLDNWFSYASNPSNGRLDLRAQINNMGT